MNARPQFKDIASFEEFSKYYWYREELQKICIARTVIKTNDPPKAADIVKRFLQTQAVTIENDMVMVACPIENIGALTNALFSENIIVSALSNDDNSAERYFIRRMEEE